MAVLIDRNYVFTERMLQCAKATQGALAAGLEAKNPAANAADQNA
jgi:hypothetical protein